MVHKFFITDNQTLKAHPKLSKHIGNKLEQIQTAERICKTESKYSETYKESIMFQAY
jgi:hypothetical protein